MWVWLKICVGVRMRVCRWHEICVGMGVGVHGCDENVCGCSVSVCRGVSVGVVRVAHDI